MDEYVKSNLRGIWLMISLLCLILPVFVSSSDSLDPLTNVIGTATITMFVISFPASLIAIPSMFVTRGLLDLTPASIGGEYFGVWMMFVFGAFQWYWLVPRLLRNANTTNQFGLLVELRLCSPVADPIIADGEPDERTPIERVLSEDR